MAELLNQKSAKKLLEKHGWVQLASGKHQIKMGKSGERSITLPQHKGQDYSKGLSAAIKKQAGIES